MQVLACASRTLSRFDRPSSARKFLSPKANIDVACRKTKIETFLQKHGQSINTFKETFLKRNAFACFKREGTDFVRIKCNKWFEADAWVFYEIKGIMYMRQSARARKNKTTFASDAPPPPPPPPESRGRCLRPTQKTRRGALGRELLELWYARVWRRIRA